MGYTGSGGPKGLGVVTTTPSTASDFNQLIALLAMMGNYRGGITEADRDAITGDALYEGLLVYNTDTDALELYDGSGWVQVVPPAGDATPTYAGSWSAYTTAPWGSGPTIARRSGLVFMNGPVTHASAPSGAQTICTLPVGFRPVKHTNILAAQGGSIIQLVLNTSGQLQTTTAFAGGSVILNLASVVFAHG